MRIIILLGFVLINLQLINAQVINAITETGDQVLLYENGTWKYLNDSIVEEKAIPVNDKKFFKDEKANFLVKSTKVDIGVWINPKSWSFVKGTADDVFEFQFQKKNGDLYGMLISEKIQIPIETLKGVAVENARSAAPDIKVEKEEYRNVNGIEVLMMQMSGTIQGMNLTYYGYYYSNPNGTIQLLTFTGESLFAEYKAEIENFLNGLVENK